MLTDAQKLEEVREMMETIQGIADGLEGLALKHMIDDPGGARTLASYAEAYGTIVDGVLGILNG